MRMESLAQDLRTHKIGSESKESKEAREAKATRRTMLKYRFTCGMRESLTIGTKEQIKRMRVANWKSLDPSSCFEDGSRI